MIAPLIPVPRTRSLFLHVLIPKLVRHICPIWWHHGRACGGSGRARRAHPAEVRRELNKFSILLPAKANKLTANHSAHFPDIHVHVAGQARASDEDDDVNVVDFKSTYTKQPTVGRSIGPSTTDNVSGSLAFYGKIIGEGRPIKYFGVTCHHVAFPPSRPAVTGDAGAPCKRGFKDAPNMMTIDGPSSHDHDLFIKASRCGVAQDRIEQHKLIDRDNLSEPGAARPLTQYEREALTETAESIQRIEAELQAVENFPRRMGTVQCSSGLHRKSPGGGIMDWALFELDQARFTKAEELNNVSFQTF